MSWDEDLSAAVCEVFADAQRPAVEPHWSLFRNWRSKREYDRWYRATHREQAAAANARYRKRRRLPCVDCGAEREPRTIRRCHACRTAWLAGKSERYAAYQRARRAGMSDAERVEARRRNREEQRRCRARKSGGAQTKRMLRRLANRVLAAAERRAA